GSTKLKSVSTTKVNEVEKVFKLTKEEKDLITLLTNVDEVPEEVVEVDAVEMLPTKCVNSVVTPRSHVTTTMSQPRLGIEPPTEKAVVGTNSKGKLVVTGSTTSF
ncbi:hypothetical protein PIB30_063108, partial [Stylosanthes scabra]|nr:hypothetical protein [Stylosanthes scabra]